MDENTTSIEIFDKVKQIIEENFPIEAEEITPDSSLQDDLKMDSFDIDELPSKCFDTFGIIINDNDMQNINTVGQLCDYVKKPPKEAQQQKVN